MNDKVNHPQHYNMGRIDVIEVIRDWKLDFWLGNAVKYIARAKHKGRLIEDLQKAIWYLTDKLKMLGASVSAQDADRARLATFASRFDRRDIGNEHGVYLERYRVHGWVPSDGKDAPRGLNVYLHHFLRSDADDALHNHPWPGVSIILTGGYSEERLVGYTKLYSSVVNKKELREGCKIETKLYSPGDVNVIGPDDFHRVDLIENDCWTLFVTGEKQQSWGFVDRESFEFVEWRERLKQRGIKPEY